nr:MAG: hypothetical protein [Microvirus sp.]
MAEKKVNPHSPVKGLEVEQFAIQRSAQEGYLDARGRELPSPLPIQPPIGYKKTPSLSEQIRAMVVSEKLRLEAEQAGFESFEDADDFDVGDDYDPRSPYEYDFDPPQEMEPAPAAAPTPSGNGLVEERPVEQEAVPQPPPAPAGGQGQGGRQPPLAKPPLTPQRRT